MKKHGLILLILCAMFTSSVGTYAGIKWLDKTETAKGGAEYYEPTITEDLAKVERAYQLILKEYVEKVNRNELIEGAVQGMIEKLNDPYSVYLNEERAKQLNDSLDSSFEGIGAEITEVDGNIIIVAPFKNSPAEKAGLKPHDKITKINGEGVAGMDVYDVMGKIRGPKGTKVVLEIIREGIKEPLTFEVERDTIPIETVFSKTYDHGGKKIGYIELTTFSRDTGKEFKEHLSKLEKTDIEGLIIDVRGNPGGLLSSAEEIANELVPNQKPFVQIVGKDGNPEKIYTRLKQKKPYPIILIMDRGSASASEVLAAALKEAGGYKTLGETTFGKGTVQQQLQLDDESHIKLTTYKWLTPDGNWIHKTGIKPDVFVMQKDLFHLHPVQTDTILKRDMNNEQISYAQRILKSLGYEPGRLDGYFDGKTENAVKAFQSSNNLPITGVIDKETIIGMEEKVKEELEKPENDQQLMMALKLLEYQDR